MKTVAKTFLSLCMVSIFTFAQTDKNESKNKLIVHADSGKNTIMMCYNLTKPF